MLNLRENSGFTLIELVIVMAIISLMSVIALPKLSGFFGNERKESSIIQAYIEAVTDDSFVKRKTNYLSIQLSKSGDKNAELFNDKYNETNILSVYELKDGKFIPNTSNILRSRSFSSSFILNEVILDGGKSITSGNVLIPFYSDGTSVGFILKIISSDSKINIIKNKTGKMVQLENEL